LGKELTGYIKERHGFSYYNSSRSVKHSHEELSEKNHVRMSDAMKQYDRSFAAQMLLLAKKQEWFTEIIEQLGITTLFMILQVAEIPAEQWYNEIKKYKKDPEAFLEFADKWMVALYDAKEDAKKYIELRQKYGHCIADREKLRIELLNYKGYLQEALTQLSAVVSILSKEQLQRFLRWLALQRMADLPSKIEYSEEEGE